MHDKCCSPLVYDVAGLLSLWLPANLPLNGAKESVEAKLDQSEVPAVRLEAFNTEYPLLQQQTWMMCNVQCIISYIENF